MKKIVKSLITVLLAIGMISQNITIETNAIEISKNNVEIQSDPLDIIDYSMGGNSNYSVSPIKEKSLSKASVSPNAIGSGIVNTDSLNVRKGSSTTYEKIGTLSKGDFVEIYGRSNGWYKIAFNNEFGYVSASYITLNIIEKGIDVSKHNGDIDWKKVKASGVDYAIIRGGYSNNYVDPYFKANIEGATKAGLKVGIYWFSYATSVKKAQEEAEKCLEVISPYKDKISYPVFYDFEYASVEYANKQGVAITKALATDMANTFINRIAAAGYDTGLYSNQDFSSRYFDNALLNSNNLWIAQYSSKCTFSKPYMMWQYSEKGSVDGINGNVDLNYTCLKSMKHDNINSQLPDTNDIYHINIFSFLGESNVKSCLEQLKKDTDWYANYEKMDGQEYYHQIKTGGFVGENNVKSALDTIYKLTGLSGKYVHEGDYYQGEKTQIYRIETGGFVGKDNVKSALEWLKKETGWWATYEPNGSIPGEYRIVTGGFVGENNVKAALKLLQDKTGWWATYNDTGEYYQSESVPIYHIYLNKTLGEDNTISIMNKISSNTGWWLMQSKTSDYENYYRIVTGGFLGLRNAQTQSQFIKSNYGWYNTITKE